MKVARESYQLWLQEQEKARNKATRWYILEFLYVIERELFFGTYPDPGMKLNSNLKRINKKLCCGVGSDPLEQSALEVASAKKMIAKGCLGNFTEKWVPIDLFNLYRNPPAATVTSGQMSPRGGSGGSTSPRPRGHASPRPSSGAGHTSPRPQSAGRAMRLIRKT